MYFHPAIYAQIAADQLNDLHAAAERNRLATLAEEAARLAVSKPLPQPLRTDESLAA